jgi:hypothetical protein
MIKQAGKIYKGLEVNKTRAVRKQKQGPIQNELVNKNSIFYGETVIKDT